MRVTIFLGLQGAAVGAIIGVFHGGVVPGGRHYPGRDMGRSDTLTAGLVLTGAACALFIGYLIGAALGSAVGAVVGILPGWIGLGQGAAYGAQLSTVVAMTAGESDEYDTQ